MCLASLGAAKPSKKQSTSSTFTAQLTTLTEQLESSSPHFIRCIKPNSTKSPFSLQSALTLEQLSYSGILSVCKIKKRGWSFRPKYEEFVGRFWCLVGNINRIFKQGKVAEVSERSERALTKTRILAMNPAKWLQT